MSEDKTTLQELIDRLAERLDCTKVHAENLIKSLQESWEEALEEEGSVRLAGLGSFKLKWQEEREGVNPSTGETIIVPAQSKLEFSPEKSLADRINAPYAHLKAYNINSENNDGFTQSTSSTPSNTDTGANIDELREEIFQDRTKRYEEEQSIAYTESDRLNNGNNGLESEKKDLFWQKEPPHSEQKNNNNLKWVLLVLFVLMTGVLTYIFWPHDDLKVSESEQPETIEQQMAETEEDKSDDWEQQEPVNSESISKDNPVLENEQNRQKGTYQINRGDNLWKIATEQYGSGHLWVLIYASNKGQITNPDLIRINQKIVVPVIDSDTKEGKITQELLDAYETVFNSYIPYSHQKADSFKKEFNRLNR